MCPQLPCASPVSNPRLDPPAYEKEGALQGVQKKCTNRKKISKIECCGAKFNHEHDLGRLDQA